jgi:DNA-binding transcriptional LysR family regulator
MMNSAPDWDLWRAFGAVMEERTLSGAARRLGLTQPTLGRQIDALEIALGAALFVRSPKGVKPTETALEVAPLARSMAATADAMLRTSRGGRDTNHGVVRLSASEIMSVQVLPEMLAEFGIAYPGIELEMHVSNAVDDLLNREADIAVRMVAPVQQALVARKLGDVEIRLYAHHSYIARKGMPSSLADIAGHRIIGYDSLTYPIKNIEEAGYGISRRDFAIRCDHDPTQHALLLAGAGIGGMQVQLAWRHPELVPVLPDAFSLPLGVWMVMHETMRDVRPTRLLFDFLSDRLGTFIAGRK